MAPRCIAEEVLLKLSVGVGEDLKEATRSACLLAAQGDWGMEEPTKAPLLAWSTSNSETPKTSSKHSEGVGGEEPPACSHLMGDVQSQYIFLLVIGYRLHQEQ